jgi:hypothetical protein
MGSHRNLKLYRTECVPHYKDRVVVGASRGLGSETKIEDHVHVWEVMVPCIS